MPWRAFTATTTPLKLLSYNPARKSAGIYNNGSANVVISQDPSDVLNQGWIIPPAGAVVLRAEDGDEPETDLYIVSTSGSQNIRVEESVGA